MMDISDATRGPIVGREGLKQDFECRAREEDDEGEQCPKNLKRSSDKDSVISKKRRKQLKPNRIATNLDDMVKVPKQILGLNNDLDNLNDLTHPVPKEELDSNSGNSPEGDVDADVHFPDPPPETSVGHGAREPVAAIDGPRALDAPEINVPSIETGPNYVTNPHFVFPLSFRPGLKGPGFWSEASLKIFNQEAYCELCKKEFCNKYFLKTHKANKHGIYAEVPPSSGPKVAGPKESNGRAAGPENGKTAGSETECDLCNKKFCNKYFVRRHKSKSHGLVEEEEPDAKIVQNSSNSTKETESTLATDPFPDDQDNQERETEREGEEETEEEQEGPLNLIVGSKGEEDAEAEDEGDECSSENIEKLQTMLLRLNPSEIESKACKVCNEAADAEHKCREYLSEGNDSSSESMTRSESHDFVYRLDQLKQMKPTNSYCEICNKELCNKYFMRTHMQRMHGIEIEHGTQIGGVVCNICNKELCSKYFLRVHKQNTHGIASPSALLAPSTSGQRPEGKPPRSDSRLPAAHFSQVCYICNKRFRSPKWLQAHFLSDHREEATTKTEAKEDDRGKVPRTEANDVISKIFWETNAASKTYNCSQCPFSTSVLAFLFVHERSHFVLQQQQEPQETAVKPSVSLQNLIHDKTFWQHKITQQVPECLDLSAGKPKFIAFEQNGS